MQMFSLSEEQLLEELMCPFCFAHTTTILAGVAGSFSAGGLGALLLRRPLHQSKKENSKPPTSAIDSHEERRPNEIADKD